MGFRKDLKEIRKYTDPSNPNGLGRRTDLLEKGMFSVNKSLDYAMIAAFIVTFTTIGLILIA